MCLCEVYDIDVVPEACSVLCRIVVSEYAQALPLADSRLGDERHEIVRNAARKLADEG